jgi:hypothetical protein
MAMARAERLAPTGASHIAGGRFTVASHLETVRYGKEPGDAKRRTRVVIQMVGDTSKQTFEMATIAMLTPRNMRDKLDAARSRVIEFASSSPASPPTDRPVVFAPGLFLIVH